MIDDITMMCIDLLMKLDFTSNKDISSSRTSRSSKLDLTCYYTEILIGAKHSAFATNYLAASTNRTKQ